MIRKAQLFGMFLPSSGLSCLLILILTFGFSNATAQDPQVEALYKVAVSTRSQPYRYIFSGNLQALQDSTIILLTAKDTRIEIPVGRVGNLRFVPEKNKNRAGVTIAGVAVGALTGHVLSYKYNQCSASNLLEVGECMVNTLHKVTAISGGALIGGIVAHQLDRPSIKIPLNGNYEIYGKQKEKLKKYVR